MMSYFGLFIILKNPVMHIDEASARCCELRNGEKFDKMTFNHCKLTPYQMHGQTVHIGGLVRLDLVFASVETVYVTIWASPSVSSLHLGKRENADELKNNHAGV